VVLGNGYPECQDPRRQLAATVRSTWAPAREPWAFMPGPRNRPCFFEVIAGMRPGPNAAAASARSRTSNARGSVDPRIQVVQPRPFGTCFPGARGIRFSSTRRPNCRNVQPPRQRGTSAQAGIKLLPQPSRYGIACDGSGRFPPQRLIGAPRNPARMRYMRRIQAAGSRDSTSTITLPLVFGSDRTKRDEVLLTARA